MDSKIVHVNFGQNGKFEYIDIEIVRYLGLNDYERWPTIEEIYEIGQRSADKILALRQKIENEWSELFGLSFQLERITNESQTKIWDKNLKDLVEIVWKRKFATNQFRIVIAPKIPKENYTIDPFIGWSCSIKPVYTGEKEVDKVINKFWYDLAWNKI